eukprot:tig00000093_g3535.t1
MAAVERELDELERAAALLAESSEEESDDDAAARAARLSVARRLYDRAKELIQQAEELKHEVRQQKREIVGLEKLVRKLKAEAAFLAKMDSGQLEASAPRVASSNLPHLEAVLHCARTLAGVVAVNQKFSLDGRAMAIAVEVVADYGATWIDVKAMSPGARPTAEQLRFEGRGIRRRARTLLRAAQQNPCLGRPPAVLFRFPAGVSEVIATLLAAMGARVEGRVRPLRPPRPARPPAPRPTRGGPAGAPEPGGFVWDVPLRPERLLASSDEDEEDSSEAEGEDEGGTRRRGEEAPTEAPGPPPPEPPPPAASGAGAEDGGALGCAERGGQWHPGAVRLAAGSAPLLNLDVTSLLALTSEISHCDLDAYSCDEGSVCEPREAGGEPFRPQEEEVEGGEAGQEEGGSGAGGEGSPSPRLLRTGRPGVKFLNKRVLRRQFEEEREERLLLRLEAVLAGRELVACASAVDQFRKVLAIAAGPRERARAEEFLRRVRTVPDCVSPRAAALREVGRCRALQKAVFGTGDSLGAVTVTTNSGFVRVAVAAGAPFDVFVHATRWLTGE